MRSQDWGQPGLHNETLSQAYTHTDCSMGCWSQQEECIARRAAALQRSCVVQQTTPIFPCSNQLLPYPRLSTAAGLCPSISTCFCRDMCQCVCDLSRNLLQGSLGHQVFRLVSHLCWWAQRKESVADCTICSVPIGAPPQSPVPLQLSDVIFVAPLEGGLDQPQGKEAH